MDLEGLRKAVRSIALEGAVAEDTLDALSRGDRQAVVSLERRARKAGSLAAVAPPTHNSMWTAPVRG